MKKRKSSAKPRNSSNESSAKMTPLGRRLLKSLEEAKEYFEGKRPLQTYTYNSLDVKSVRRKTGLSQSQFASRFAIELRTLQDWEQGRRSPDATVRAYLTVIDRNPAAVEEALKG
jgi:putative transcriptional regulator